MKKKKKRSVVIDVPDVPLNIFIQYSLGHNDLQYPGSRGHLRPRTPVGPPGPRGGLNHNDTA